MRHSERSAARADMVIPSGAPEARSRGIALIPAEGPSVGTGTIPRLRGLTAASLGMTRLVAAFVLLAAPELLGAQGRSVDWPVYGGNTDNTHYSTLGQITPANVSRLRVAWTYKTGDEFPGSEMQANPIVIDGVLYATSPKMRVFALDAATGRELWSFDPSEGQGRSSRFRHRGVIVHGDRVFFTHRSRLWALDKKTDR